MTLLTNSTLSIFLSTPSGWRATLFCFRLAVSLKISIHALRVEGDEQKIDDEKSVRISIHALRVEGDRLNNDLYLARLVISIHALRVEGDVLRLDLHLHNCISIHALRVEGDLFLCRCLIKFLISIHALRVEGDLSHPIMMQLRVSYFYPRPPGGGRHARCFQLVKINYFYPRPPGGGRQLQL